MNAEKATVKDIKEIHSLIKFFSGKNSLLSKSEDDLFRRINDLFVLKHEGKVIGCAAIVVYGEKHAEICSLAVSPKYQKKNGGTILLRAVTKRTQELGIENIFALTYVPDFFKRHGFSEIDKDDLPEKIWKDCINCPYFQNCNETAVILKI